MQLPRFSFSALTVAEGPRDRMRECLPVTLLQRPFLFVYPFIRTATRLIHVYEDAHCQRYEHQTTMAFAPKISLTFLLILSLLFCFSTAARPLPPAPSPTAPTLLHGATSSLSKAFKNVFDAIQPAATISKNPGRVDQYLRGHFATVLQEAVRALHSKDRSIMASFLDSQLMGLLDSQDSVLWTVFAPSDEDLGPGNFREDLSSSLMRHLVPGRDVALMDLNLMANGTRFQKNMDGVPLQLTRNKDQLMINGVEITNPDLFRGPWLVVHGIKGVIPRASVEDQQTHETDGFYFHGAVQGS